MSFDVKIKKKGLKNKKTIKDMLKLIKLKYFKVRLNGCQ